jgi:hypothetical protein
MRSLIGAGALGFSAEQARRESAKAMEVLWLGAL